MCAPFATSVVGPQHRRGGGVVTLYRVKFLYEEDVSLHPLISTCASYLYARRKGNLSCQYLWEMGSQLGSLLD